MNGMQDQKGGLKKLLPADGIIVARSPDGGIGTPRFKSNWQERYARNTGPPILWKCDGPRQDACRGALTPFFSHQPLQSLCVRVYFAM